MNLNLKPHPLVAHWIPGFVACSIILFSVFIWDYEWLINLITHTTTQGLALIIFLLSIVSFVIGEALDAIRNSFIEDCLDKKSKINWDFFSMGEREKITNIDEWYFTWYAFSVNMCSAILIGLVGALLLYFIQVLCLQTKWPILPIILLIIIIVLLGLVKLFYHDAKELRKEMKVSIDKLLDNKNGNK